MRDFDYNKQTCCPFTNVLTFNDVPFNDEPFNDVPLNDIQLVIAIMVAVNLVFEKTLICTINQCRHINQSRMNCGRYVLCICFTTSKCSLSSYLGKIWN